MPDNIHIPLGTVVKIGDASAGAPSTWVTLTDVQSIDFGKNPRAQILVGSLARDREEAYPGRLKPIGITIDLLYYESEHTAMLAALKAKTKYAVKIEVQTDISATSGSDTTKTYTGYFMDVPEMASFKNEDNPVSYQIEFAGNSVA